MRSKAVWNFSENSSVLEAPPVPKPEQLTAISDFRKDLMIRGLPDRIHDCHQMNMLYPSIPKANTNTKKYKHDFVPKTIVLFTS